MGPFCYCLKIVVFVAALLSILKFAVSYSYFEAAIYYDYGPLLYYLKIVVFVPALLSILKFVVSYASSH